MAETDQQRRVRTVKEMIDERSTRLAEWRALAEYGCPPAGVFIPSQNPNQRRVNRGKIYDPEAELCLLTLVAGFESNCTNKAMPWVLYKMADPDLNRFKPVKEWLEIAKNVTLEVFLKSNIYSTFPKVYRDLGLFATGGMSIEDDFEHNTLHTKHLPIGSYAIATNRWSRVDTFCQEYKLTTVQMVEEFGLDKVSEQVKTAYAKGNYGQWFDVVWLVEPNRNAKKGALFSKDKAFQSMKWEPSNAESPLSIKGYDENPCMFPRWDVEGESPYGTSCPGMIGHGTNKSLQKRELKALNALDKLIDPSMQGPPGTERASHIPASITIVPQGQGEFKPSYQIDPHFREMQEVKMEAKQTLQSIFYVNLFRMLTNGQNKDKTAYEIAAMKDEGMQQLGPVSTRTNDELLDQVVERTFGILMRAGMLPPPPPEMSEAVMAIEYITPMSLALKTVGITAIERLFQFAFGTIYPMYPEVVDKLDFDKSIDQYSERIGAPPDLVRDDNETAGRRDQRAKGQQMAQAAATMQAAAQTGKTLADTNVTNPSALTQIQAAMQGQGALPGASGVMPAAMQGGVPNG